MVCEGGYPCDTWLGLKDFNVSKGVRSCTVVVIQNVGTEGTMKT